MRRMVTTTKRVPRETPLYGDAEDRYMRRRYPEHGNIDDEPDTPPRIPPGLGGIRFTDHAPQWLMDLYEYIDLNSLDPK